MARDEVTRACNGVHPLEPGWHTLPAGRAFAAPFHELREAVFTRIEDYYDREHLTRAGDWMLVIEPEAPEHLVLAALTHDLERSVPGGPKLEMATTPWDDRAYNDAHTGRSAELVPPWLAEQGAPPAWVDAVAQPIREHEFGGSPEGDLMQAVDSISFLETNGVLVASWASREMCTRAKALEKLEWMCERVRLERAKPIAEAYYRHSLEVFERELAG
jgi:hypothetical protein